MNNALSWLHRAGSVRRVLRRGDQHVCGLCRCEYGSLALAHSCVLRCWSEFLASQAVIVRSKGKRVSYRCRFCARDHLEKGAAVNCTKACRNRLVAAFEVELSLSDLAVDLPSHPPKRTKPMLRLMVIQGPRSKKRTEQLQSDLGGVNTVVADEGVKNSLAYSSQEKSTVEQGEHANPDAATNAELKVAKVG